MNQKINALKRRGWKISLVFGAILIASLLGACSGTIVSSSTNPPGANNAPGSALPSYQNSGSEPTKPIVAPARNGTVASGNSRGYAGPASLYPNPELTPGDVFPGVTSREVCTPGYSKSVRAVSSEEKSLVYQHYGISDTPGQHEVDHFIPLELGGSNDLKNLWPEPYTPKPGAHEKDTVENALHAEVCAGRMSLTQAQTLITQDWYAYYLQIKKPG